MSAIPNKYQLKNAPKCPKWIINFKPPNGAPLILIKVSIIPGSNGHWFVWSLIEHSIGVFPGKKKKMQFPIGNQTKDSNKLKSFEEIAPAKCIMSQNRTQCGELSPELRDGVTWAADFESFREPSIHSFSLNKIKGTSEGV